MPRYVTHLTFMLLAVTALSGLWMRLVHLLPAASFTPSSFLLHAHSHGALLGWAFLGVFLLFLHVTWQDLQQKKQAILLFVSAFLVTAAMYIAFLLQGYAMWSILFSVLHIGIEYWMALLVYRHIRETRQLPPAAALFLKGALLTLLISSIGPFSLGAIAMKGLKDTAIFEMAVYFFLHFQYNGWLYLFLIGLFLMILHKKAIRLPTRLLTWSFWITFAGLFPGFLQSILWYDIGTAGVALAAVGTIAQWIGVLLFLLAVWQKRLAIQTAYSIHLIISLLFTFALLFVKSTIEIGLLHPSLATLVFDTRSVIIGYLHLTLLGFITIFILTQLQMTALLNESKNSVLLGIGIFILGFMLNEAVLFLTGFASWFEWQLPAEKILLLLAACGLLIGTLMLWGSIFRSDKQSS